MSDENAWNTARLIPTSGINGADEQERRATSALLAVMSSVREFGRTLVGPLGAPAAALETFIEVPFQVGERKVFPDGLIRARRGTRTWTALVEVKTGANALNAEQIETYLDVAKERGYQAVITVSNEIPPAPGTHPTAIDRRKLKKVELHHWSWTEVVTHAVMQKEFRGVADPEQAWILGELIRYLEHPRSGALAFEDMGQSWVPVREAIASGTLRAGDRHAAEVAARFDALVRFACLQLGRRLGTEVTPVTTRQEAADPALRTQSLVATLVADGCLHAAVRIPNTVSPLAIVVDVRSARITCSFDLDAPKEGRPTTRVNWLLRQLRDSPDALRVEAFALRARSGSAELLRDVRTDPNKLITDPTRELRSFRIAQTHPMGTKRGTGRNSFIDSVLAAVDTTYGDVGQRLKGWAAAPPKMRSADDLEIDRSVPADLPSAALSSQDHELVPQIA